MTLPSRKHSLSEAKCFIDEFKIPAKAKGVLSNLTFAVKDIIDVSGYKTGCGNPTWQRIQPTSLTNSICVDQLLYSGATCLGKTVTSEFAFDLTGENSFFQTPLNPQAPDRVPGGSSNGSASAVACGLVDFAIGTDTGGSVRVPASYCGIFGMRPSHGIISLSGVMALAPSFDTVGFFARSQEVLAKVATCLLSFEGQERKKIEKIYVLDEAMALVDDEVKQALGSIIKQFAECAHVMSLASQKAPFAHGLKSWYDTFVAIQLSEIWNSLGAWIETFAIPLGEAAKASFELAKNYPRENLLGAIQKRELFFKKINDLLGSQNLICLPTCPTVAPIKGSIGKDRSKGNYYPRLLTLTSIAGIGRLPQVTLPLAEVNGIPIGISLIASHGNDAFLISAVEYLLKTMDKEQSSLKQMKKKSD